MGKLTAGLLSGVASQRHADHRYDHAVRAHTLVLLHASSLIIFDETMSVAAPKTFSSLGLRPLLWYEGISELCGGTLHLEVRGHRRFLVLERP